MEEINSNRTHQYNKLQHSLELPNKPTINIQSNGTFPRFTNSMEHGTNGKTNYMPENGILGRTYKVSLVSLKRVGSTISFTPSRKSSAKSVNSKASSDSNKSQIRKNSGQFDGCTSRVRKHSSGRKVSSQTRKMSSNSQRNEILTELYRELDQLKETEFTSSSEDEDDSNNNVQDREDLERKKRVESYVKEHSIYKKINFDLGGENINNKLSNGNNDATGRLTYRSNSNSSDRTHVKKHENIFETPKMVKPIMRREESKKRSSTLTSDTDEGYYSSHTQITSNRLTKLFLVDTGGLPANDTFHVVPRTKDKLLQSKSSINPKLFHYLQVPEEASPPNRDVLSRGSINSISSFNSTISNSDSVPMNFIPGQTKPLPRQSRSNSLSLNIKEKVKFCFKGITCQVDRTTPKTFKAMAHAGMLSISIIGPSEHKCSH